MPQELDVEAVESFLRLAKDTLTDGSDLLLSRFGKFQVRDKAPRKGRNPQTGEDLLLEARRVVTFSPSGILRKKLIEQNKNDRKKTPPTLKCLETEPFCLNVPTGSFLFAERFSSFGYIVSIHPHSMGCGGWCVFGRSPWAI